MYVCLCKGVTDHDIRRVVSEGAESIREVRIATGAMTQCGKCACLAKQIVNETLGEKLQNKQNLFYEVA